MPQTVMKKRVLSFSEGSAEIKDLMGGKGANLAEMTRLGLPVPAGFTVTTKACLEYLEKDDGMPDGLMDEVKGALTVLESQAGQRFGDPKDPLLVSVRSGAVVSMPGMMDTVLNLGLNEETVQGLAQSSGDGRFAYDAYRRFVTMFGDVVLGIPHARFEELLDDKKADRGVEEDVDLDTDALRELTHEMIALVEAETGRPFPSDPMQQLEEAITAVFRSWNNKRAITYRKLNRIPDGLGTAVNVQMMVFGNLGDDCATGVAFTRDPASGENRFYGEFLPNAQGEDVVAGTRTPHTISDLKKEFPEAYDELVSISRTLEAHYKDMQDIEFTIMRGKLYMLQTRTGKRTGMAAVRIALDMLDEGVIDEETCLRRVAPDQLNQLLRPVFDPKEKQSAVTSGRIIAKGLNAGPGGATGRVVFTADEAAEWHKRGEKVILVRHETSPEDIHGMHASEGFLTARGGMTSHAALVARQMGKVCVAGCGAVRIDYQAKAFSVGGHVVREGEWLSLDGFTGEVIKGQLTTLPSEVVQVLVDKTLDAKDAPVYTRFARLLDMADKVRRMRVRANADQPDQAIASIAFGAEGIGLCRTEHMFFGPGKIEHMQEMILSEDETQRRKALMKLLPIQRDDFAGLFRAMGARPVTIRLLDPPLHEFLPHEERDQRELALMMDLDLSVLRIRIEGLREANPMLGHRGCRLGITYPEITEMQARAILEAACIVKKEGVEVKPEIMIPIVGSAAEFEHQEDVVRRVAEQVFKEKRTRVDYLVGTMIEIPRAALTADEIAERAEFFSFGTNDLTQTTLGVSRDDAGGFLAYYQENGLMEHDPFATIDARGVGRLVETGTRLGRQTRPELKVGICGEHGGDPDSVKFCHRTGLDYVSCSPYRLPIARLAAAHAVLEEKAKDHA
ncbi:MAG: pyruvate, phosphate dikinase [Euryarchaeota archaeon]|nr:pyruvate, phosphate dikinase [Euryarchaeota archaeon]